MANDVKSQTQSQDKVGQIIAGDKLQEGNSVVGHSNGCSGEYRADGLLRIDGDFRGTIKGKGVILIGENGRIVGDVYAKSIRIGGKIKGNIYALEKVEILAGGKLIGDFHSPRFMAEEGMIFTGNGKTPSHEEIKKIFEKDVNHLAPIIEEDF